MNSTNGYRSVPTMLTPPNSPDAEKAVLGSLLLNGDALDEVLGIVSADDFYQAAHGMIFDAIVHVHNSGRECDPLILAEHLKQAGTLAEIGDLPYLHEILETVPHAAHAAHYARIVAENSQRREIVRTATEAARRALEDPAEPAEIVAQAESRLHKILARDAGAGPVELGRVLLEAAAAREQDADPGLPTGWPDLDRLTHGLRPGHLIYLAARPSMGKTAFAANLTLQVASDGRGVLFFSLEQSREEVGERLLCSSAGVSSHKLRVKALNADEWERVADHQNRLTALRIAIDDSAGQTVSQMAAQARLRKRGHGLDLIVIDYLQLVQPADIRIPREQQVATISRTLKFLARDLQTPVVVLAQLNRGVESRDDKRPRLFDLRESGSIEQDADMVLFLHRPAVYDETEDETEAELILAKHRNGPTGPVKLRWDAPTMTFQSAACGNWDDF